jgi:uncharacterized protein
MSKHIERRFSTSQIEIRQSPDGIVTVRGLAAAYDYPAHGEVIRSSAFTKTLAESDDVRLLVNHDGVPLARTKSGTLRLSSDDTGLWIEADLDPTNPTARELISAMERGDIDQMSFAFQMVKEKRDADGLRNILEARLFDVSIVTFPWYDITSVELLSAPAVEMCLRSLSAEDRAAIIANVADVAPDAADDIEPEPAPAEPVEDPQIEAARAADRLLEARKLLGLDPAA